MKDKKIIIILLGLGVLFVLSGVITSLFLPKNEEDKKEAPKVEIEEEKAGVSQLSCVRQQNEQNILLVLENSVFEFSEEGLIKVSTDVDTSTMVEEGKQSILLMNNTLTGIKNTLGVLEGYTLNTFLSSDNSSLKISTLVDFNLFDLETFKTQNPNTTLTLDFQKGMTPEEINLYYTQLGGKCTS